ncbi:hypothetical protein [Sphingobium yanoikuyae]|uniref:hypothetical protein n=1 Tax=Sphingobium yanoikuyae TaxID=13690 RepID=UPI000F7E1A2F|nr:hypothetical protein [Sphingobium yanoikuyae]
MSFQIDRTARRVFDAEKGLELRTVSGGNSGMIVFHLVRGGDKIVFYGHMDFRPNPDFDPNDLATKNIIIWRITVGNCNLPGLTTEDTRQAICESLTVFKASYGVPANSVTEVILPLFQPAGTDAFERLPKA